MENEKFIYASVNGRARRDTNSTATDGCSIVFAFIRPRCERNERHLFLKATGNTALQGQNMLHSEWHS